MEDAVRKYLSEIGKRGGRKSRRKLDPTTAREMALVREARRAFHRFYIQCFWSYDPDYKVTVRDIKWVGEQLMKHGGREAWKAGARLCH